MDSSNRENSKIPDITSGKKDVLEARDMQNTDGTGTRSVSAISGICSTGERDKPKDSSSKGVSIKNFDSLIDHMASLNVKFFN